MMRPDSLRKTDSMVSWRSFIGHALRHLTEWADLDQPATPLTTSRNLCGPFQSFVQVLAIEDIEPRQLLLGLGVWAIGDHDFAVLHADSGRGDAGRKRFSATQNAATLGLIQ